ncbi:unnamed protein product [[Candida] boidinii]|uniref:Elongator complex protein 1 n=1 Tax=Candida boidinii TaxID=5477 RepID=A0A9W6WG91_CANBO|nr:hypothetical protein B5S30_g1706 [[Candida] boidinii]OWB82650.1 hypothetical protein B5S33_g1278 [[Candida] boidinii]GME69118.1 unnamed protein product [[Candida] boidinii]GMF98243.1 unnamed protein product [[Candida] boidinii]
MKNLRILNKGQVVPQSRTYPDLAVITSKFDVINDSITIVLGSHEFGIYEVQQFLKTGEVKILASFPVKTSDKLLNFVHFEDSLQLILVFENGDIINATYDPISPDSDTTMVEIVGSIDCGIHAAQWSPDEETLALLTKENNIVLLSRLFEPITESFMNPNDINEQSNHVALGWGKKETQFQGKGAKQIERERSTLKASGLDIDSENAILHDPTVSEIQTGVISEYDTKDCKISWRGDAQFFAITSIEDVTFDTSMRIIRVYSRDGELISCSEPTDRLEENLSWKPQGSLIASTQRRFEPEINEEVLDVIFFEKNGLRHGEFTSRLPPGSKILDLDWSSNSEIIAVQLSHSIQLWTTKNYHWYLKQEISSINNIQINFLQFHPEKPLKLMIGTHSSIEIVDLSYCISSGPTAAPYDLGMTLVTDGTTCMITPISIANVPPPASLREFDVDEPIVDMAVSQSNELISVLTQNEVYLVSLKINNSVKPPVKAPELISRLAKITFTNENSQVKQIAMAGNDIIAVLFDGDGVTRIAMIDIFDITKPTLKNIIDVLPPKAVLLKSNYDFSAVTFGTADGSVYEINNSSSNDEDNSTYSKINKFPQLCTDYSIVSLSPASSQVEEHEHEVDAINKEWGKPNHHEFSSNVASFGLSQTGKFFCNGKLLCSGVTSFLTTESLLIYTTAKHQLKFVHLLNNDELYDPNGSENILESASLDYDERTRLIERGSLLVSAIPSKALVVLQAPRGNLETICPRIMVLTGVRKQIKEKHYREAFLTCRTHRIALDIIYDYNPESFVANVEKFIKDINSVEYLDLFLSGLYEEDVCETKYKETLTTDNALDNNTNNNNNNINTDFAKLSINNNETEKFVKPVGKEKISFICENILKVLVTPEYKTKFLQTIVTAYACQHPPKTEEALELIGTLEKEAEVEKTVQHLCFLLDVNKLYNISLGIYNIPLALVVAQQSQKDPKEYLPFLQDLHVLPDLRKKFTIDTHLKKYSKALESLTKITTAESPDIDEEIVNYVIERELYQDALKIYRYNDEKKQVILKAYADFLHSKQEYTEAGLAYEQLGHFELALESYVLGKKWEEAIALSLSPELEDKLTDISERLVTSLIDVHKYSSAAYINYKFLNNFTEALKLYCKDYSYEHAILLCLEEKKPELIEQVVEPAIGEGFGVVAELLADCKGQITSQLNRLRELRTKKEEDPYAFYGGEGELNETADNVSIAASETSTKESFFTRYTGKTSGTAKTGASRRTAKNRRREERKKARGKKGTIYEEEYLVRSVGRLLERLENTEPEAVSLIEALLRRKQVEQAYQIQKNFIEVIELLKANIVEIYSISERDRERIDENGMVYYVPEIPVPTVKEFPKKKILDY